ncbi:MAG: amino acid permease [Candidatus Sumerlaeaceae bacterium]|nr:amino acid permease [Candidatus Sumerlaeaceae bacterium]
MSQTSPQAPDNRSASGSHPVSATKVVVVTTVMLTFISFWRAAAVVLSDLASTAYYIGGIAEQAIGKSAPWFILAVMIFSLGVRSIYFESCSMFVRGGVYRIVKEAMGSTMAKISVSALVFDYVLTGPISSVSAGQYIHGLLNNTLVQFFHVSLPISADMFSMTFAVAITVYFWRLNIRGIEESSHKALRIMQITGVMVIILILWSLLTMYLRRDTVQLPPFQIQLNPATREHTLGWLSHLPGIETLTWALVLVGFGHSLLAMSGEETLAQVYREIEAPKHRNLMRAGILIFVFSTMFTAFVSFAAVMLIPDATRKDYLENLLNGLVMAFSGPTPLKLAFQAVVVVVGALILSGAVNTSIIGSNGVLNRVAEDGILDDWFRKPHSRFGTTYRIIDMVAILQIITIIATHGEIYVLGEAYAFGVVWSFTFMGLAMLILRFKFKGERSWRVPVNFHIGKTEIPAGLLVVVSILVTVAIVNLFTKKVATISGVIFTVTLFAVFMISEYTTRRRREREAREHEHIEKFTLERKSEVDPETLELPAGRKRILVPVRDPHNLVHLKKALEEAHELGTEVIVMTIKVEKGDQSFQNLFTNEQEKLFTKVIELAEKYGEAVVPIVVPSNNSWFAIARTAKDIGAEEILLGKSGRIPEDVQMEQLAIMWSMVATGKEKPLRFRIISADDELDITL